ncbi:hypothetical protein V6N13_040490 [Hibiscus sabdariffa]|uniref:C2H2-type domain-containing protein n=1 Tax=Hibiscus sabdariffa TaxID=183260 RepID=A0ABR2R931_9ROSI
MGEEQEFKHVCKFCLKSFPCGRSLGGHMRSHMNNSTETDGEFNNCILGQKPKKTWRRLSLFNGKICKEKQDSWRSKTRRRRTTRYKVVPANPSSKVEQEQQEEVALSLIMLSRHVSFKREFHCTTCKKIFHSHQALGGHRASRKRINGGCAETTAIETDTTKLVDEAYMSADIVAEDKVHECPICLKVFVSGQALGGHKRSHLLTHAKQNQTIVIQKPKVNEFLDLNLTAPDEDETSVRMGFNQWWGESNHNHKPKALVAFISN